MCCDKICIVALQIFGFYVKIRAAYQCLLKAAIHTANIQISENLVLKFLSVKIR